MLLFITINYTLSSAILQVYFTIFFSSSMQKNKIYAVCKFLGFRLWRPRRFALGTRPARCRCRILQSRERRFAFPSGWGRLYCGQAGGYLSGTPLRSAQSRFFYRLQALPAVSCRRRSRAEPPDADRVIERYPDGG